MYDTDGIYNKEQHDSYVWDYVKKNLKTEALKTMI